MVCVYVCGVFVVVWCVGGKMCVLWCVMCVVLLFVDVDCMDELIDILILLFLLFFVLFG